MTLKTVSTANKGINWTEVQHCLWVEHKTKMSIIVTHSFWWLQKGLHLYIPCLNKYRAQWLRLRRNSAWSVSVSCHCWSTTVTQITMSTFINPPGGIKIPTMLESSSGKGLQQLKEQLLHFQAQKMFQEEVGKKDFLEAFTGRCESLVLWAARQRKKKSIFSYWGENRQRGSGVLFSCLGLQCDLHFHCWLFNEDMAQVPPLVGREEWKLVCWGHPGWAQEGKECDWGWVGLGRAQPVVGFSWGPETCEWIWKPLSPSARIHTLGSFFVR